MMVKNMKVESNFVRKHRQQLFQREPKTVSLKEAAQAAIHNEVNQTKSIQLKSKYTLLLQQIGKEEDEDRDSSRISSVEQLRSKKIYHHLEQTCRNKEIPTIIHPLHNAFREKKVSLIVLKKYEASKNRLETHKLTKIADAAKKLDQQTLQKRFRSLTRVKGRPTSQNKTRRGLKKTICEKLQQIFWMNRKQQNQGKAALDATIRFSPPPITNSKLVQAKSLRSIDLNSFTIFHLSQIPQPLTNKVTEVRLLLRNLSKQKNSSSRHQTLS